MSITIIKVYHSTYILCIAVFIFSLPLFTNMIKDPTGPDFFTISIQRVSVSQCFIINSFIYFKYNVQLFKHFKIRKTFHFRKRLTTLCGKWKATNRLYQPKNPSLLPHLSVVQVMISLPPMILLSLINLVYNHQKIPVGI